MRWGESMIEFLFYSTWYPAGELSIADKLGKLGVKRFVIKRRKYTNELTLIIKKKDFTFITLQDQYFAGFCRKIRFKKI